MSIEPTTHCMYDYLYQKLNDPHFQKKTRPVERKRVISETKPTKSKNIKDQTVTEVEHTARKKCAKSSKLGR